MSNYRPLPTSHVEKFLTHKGFRHKRTVGSHDQWVKSGFRTIPLWGNAKEIPALHLKTICKGVGISMEDLYRWVEDNC